MFPRDHLNQWVKGQGLWNEVSADEWNSWAWQIRSRILTVEQLKKHINLTEDEELGCQFANQKLSLAITPYYFNLINRDDPDCAIRKQVIPRGAETWTAPEELLDPVGEEKTMPVKGLVHKRCHVNC